MSYSKSQHNIPNGRSNLGPLDSVSDTLPQGQHAPNDRMNCYQGSREKYKIKFHDFSMIIP